MSDHNRQYGPPPGSQQYYPPPPRQEYPQQGGHHGGDAYSPGSYASPQPQGAYSYQPPREDQYRRSPVPPNMQVGQYQQDDYDQRGYSQHHRGSQGGLYAPPPAVYDDRPSSRNSKDRGEKPTHSAEKSLGATLLGGAAGALAGHEIGKGGMSTVIGALAGAYGGHELEKHREKKKEKKRRESGSLGHGENLDNRRRSSSRRRSRGSRRDSSSDSSDDGQRRRRSTQRY